MEGDQEEVDMMDFEGVEFTSELLDDSSKESEFF